MALFTMLRNSIPPHNLKERRSLRDYTSDFRERNAIATKAKSDLLAKFKLAADPNNPDVTRRRAERQAIVEARRVRMAQREADRIARETKAAEEAAMQAKKAAEQAALEAERAAKIEREKAEAEARARKEKADHIALLVAAEKSIREAKLAARKGGKKARRDALMKLTQYEQRTS
jgi:Family of unknown function (DUF6481)